jgi:hypothetical protein
MRPKSARGRLISSNTAIEDRSRVFTVLRQGTDLGILALIFHRKSGDRRDILPAVPVHLNSLIIPLD